MNVSEFMGGNALPLSFDVLVTTPEAFLVAQEVTKHAATLDWSTFGVLVFDEVHHVLKNHPYRKIAQQLLALSPVGAIQVIGLSASLTYSMTQTTVQKTILKLTRELRITHMATANIQELQESGYHGSITLPELLPDDLPSYTPTNVLPLEKRKPHLMLALFLERQTNHCSTIYAGQVWAIVKLLEDDIVLEDPSFRSPITSGKSCTEWGLYAHKKCYKLADEKIQAWYAVLEHFYEAMRILVISWEEDEEASIAFMTMLTIDRPLFSVTFQATLRTFEHNLYGYNFVRFRRLQEVLHHKYEVLHNFRGIVFVQQRITTHILAHLIHRDSALAVKFHCGVLYAHASSATASLRLTATEARTTLEKFASGEINLLITTVVAEEGLDVAEANCVIRYDPILHSVSFVQGRGRARQCDSAFVILRERPDRTVNTLEQIEELQTQIVQSFQPATLTSEASITAENMAQDTREKTARATLLTTFAMPDGVVLLNEYCQKTKAAIVENYAQTGTTWTCTLKYRSVLRTCTASGASGEKKKAKQNAAVQLLSYIRASTA